MLDFIPNDELVRQEEEAQRAEREQARQLEGFESSLAAHIRKAWDRNRMAKEPIRRRMEDALRARRGEYDADTLREIEEQGGSAVFMMLTATKCRAAKAWIRDILMPPGDKAWGLEPTPVPDVPKEFKAMIVAKARQEYIALAQRLAQQGEHVPPDLMQQIGEEIENRVKQAAQKRAREAAEKMERKIADQLEEARFNAELDDFIDDFVTFPAACIKGPQNYQRHALKWVNGFKAQRVMEIGVRGKRVSPFDIYPAPNASSVNDGDFIEHLHLDRGQVYRCLGVPGYNDDAIRAVLEEYGRGGLKDWLWGDYERAKLEDKSRGYLHSEGLIDGIHYWGSVQGLLLLEWGMPVEQVPDPLAEYEIDAVLIGRHVIRARLNDDPLGGRPYHVTAFQRVPGSFWGMSVPELMADIQRICNAAARNLVNNMALASGPQVEVYRDRLADGETADQIYPWKIWDMKSDPAGAASNARAVNFFQPDSNAAELMAVFEKFELKADDATNIPRYAYGNERIGGAGSTASGLSMLLESASKGIKDAIANIDFDVIRPFIHRMWIYNMENDPDEAIKGDSKVVPRGAAVLVAKDSAQARRLEMLALTGNGMDMQIIGIEGRAKILRDLFKQAGLQDDIIPSQDELEKKLAAQAQQPSPEAREQEREDMRLQLEAAEKERQFQLKEREIEIKEGKLALEARSVQLRNSQSQISDILRRAGIDPGVLGRRPPRHGIATPPRLPAPGDLL